MEMTQSRNMEVDRDGDAIMKDEVSLNIINNLFLPVMCGIVVCN